MLTAWEPHLCWIRTDCPHYLQVIRSHQPVCMRIDMQEVSLTAYLVVFTAFKPLISASLHELLVALSLWLWVRRHCCLFDILKANLSNRNIWTELNCLPNVAWICFLKVPSCQAATVKETCCYSQWQIFDHPAGSWGLPALQCFCMQSP